MSQLVKRYSLFFTVLVGFSLFFNSLSVYAQSSSTLRTTDRLINQVVNSDPVDVTNSYYSVFLKSFNPLFSSDDDRNVDAFKRDYAKALDNGTILLLQSSSSPSSTEQHSSVFLYFNYKKDCSVSLQRTGDFYYLYTGSSDVDCRFRAAKFDANPVANYYGNSYSSLSNRVMISSSVLSIFSYYGEYTVDASAVGAPALPKARPLDANSFVPDWNDNCGLDVGCHLGNIGTAVKSFFSFFIGMFDFSENNSLLKILKWLFIPKDTSVWDFSSLSDPFDKTFGSVLSFIDTLKKTYNAFVPPISYYPSSAYCSTSPVGDAGIHDSASHHYLFKSKVFGADFNPDICSFERVIGGHGNMSHIRTFTSVFLYAVSLFLWYSFMLKVTGGRL